mgnify:CR=1 FL=1
MHCSWCFKSWWRKYRACLVCISRYNFWEKYLKFCLIQIFWIFFFKITLSLSQTHQSITFLSPLSLSITFSLTHIYSTTTKYQIIPNSKIIFKISSQTNQKNFQTLSPNFFFWKFISKMLTLVWFLYIGANCCGVFLHSINKLIGLTLVSHYVANATNSSIVSIFLSSSVCCPITLTFANHILVVREWKSGSC